MAKFFFLNFACEEMDSFTDKFDKEDYYFSEEGYIVFTEAYHLKRGYCCESNCSHCPYMKRDKGKGQGAREIKGNQS